MNNYVLNIYDLVFLIVYNLKVSIYIVILFIIKYKKSYIFKVLFWFFFRERERVSKSDYMY